MVDLCIRFLSFPSAQCRIPFLRANLAAGLAFLVPSSLVTGRRVPERPLQSSERIPEASGYVTDPPEPS
jgi:hypothetical protein